VRNHPELLSPLQLCFFFRQRREHDVFQALLKMVPGLEERLTEGIEGDVATIAEMVSHELCISTILYYANIVGVTKGHVHR
jgi:hypothetical protein